MAKNPFEDSKYDDDRGVKEGSPDDFKRDKAGVAKMKRDYKAEGKPVGAIKNPHGGITANQGRKR